MSDFFDDDSDFWDGQRSEPTIQIERVRRRTPERTRSHGIVRKDATPPSRRIDLREADEAADFETMWVEPSRPGWAQRRSSLGVLGNVDPRLLSVGAVTLAVVLAVPLFGALTKDDGAETFRTVTQSSSTTTSTVPELTTTTVVVVQADNTPVDDDASDSESASDSDSGSDESSTASSGNAAGFQMASDDDDAPTDDTVLAAPSVRSAAQCGNPYEVQAGDFWVMLADAVGMSVDEFLEYNEADVDTALYPGDTICLPLGESVVPETTAPPATEAPATDAPTTVAPVTAAPTTPTTEAPSTDAPTTTDAPAPETTQAPDTTQPAANDDDEDDGGIPLPTNPVPSGGEVEAMIREIWPDDQEEQALRIAWRESNYRPDVTSSIGCCHGVFQIHEQHLSWLADYGITSVSQLFDARTNIQAAYYLYQRSGGWGPWQ